MNIVPKAGLTICINDSGHKKVSVVRINRVSILSRLISVKIYELFRWDKRNCLLYLVTYRCQYSGVPLSFCSVMRNTRVLFLSAIVESEEAVAVYTN